MKRFTLIVIIAMMLVPSAALAGSPSFKEYTQTLLRIKKNELVRLQNGETGVEGYALFGTTPPAYMLTGDVWADQLVSTKSRITVLNKEIAFLQYVLIQLNQPPQTGSGTAGSGGSPVQGTAMLLTAKSNRDMVGRNEAYKGNGRFDAVFRAQFSAPNRTVTAVEVINTNGLRSVWDTRPNNRLWLGGVVIGGRAMNRPDGSVNFSLGSGQNTLDFFVEDNGSIRGGKTNYRMTIFFASGDPLIMDITLGGGGAGSSNPNISGGIKIESATYGANCGVAEGNVTTHIAEQCNGKSKCRYTVDHKIIGDPAYGCAKTYTVRYRCGNNPQVIEKSLPAEAGWGDKAVLLECAD